MPYEPVDGLSHAVAEWMFGPETDLSRNELGELTDRDFLATAEIDGLGPVVAFGRERDRLRGVFDIKELARRRPIAPEDDARLPAFFRSQELADHSGDDVGR